MFPALHELHRLRRLNRLGRLHRLGALQAVAAVPAVVHQIPRWTHAGFAPVRRRGPSIGRLLVAGLAVFAFVWLMTAAQRPNRWRFGRLATGVMLVAVAALMLSLRRSARRRYRW
jgi:hypothetical protein